MSTHEEQLKAEIARLDQRIDDLSLTKLRETNRVLRRDIDLIVPVSHAEIHISSSTATTISDNTTYFLVNATTYTLSVTGNDFTHSGGRLTYTGERIKMMHVFSSFSMESASANQIVEIGVRKNGTIIESSVIERILATANDVGSSAMHSMFTMKKNDIIDVGVRNTSGSNNITFDFLNLGILSMPNNMTGITVP